MTDVIEPSEQFSEPREARDVACVAGAELSNIERAVFGNASSSRELLARPAFPNTARPILLKRLLRRSRETRVRSRECTRRGEEGKLRARVCISRSSEKNSSLVSLTPVM